MFKIHFFEGAAFTTVEVDHIPNSTERMRLAKDNGVPFYDRFTVATEIGNVVLDSNYFPDINIMGGQEFIDSGVPDEIAPPPRYEVIEDAPVYDNFNGKVGADKKEPFASVSAGDIILLYDCDPEVVNYHLVGVGTLDGMIKGFMDKTKIKPVPEEA